MKLLLLPAFALTTAALAGTPSPPAATPTASSGMAMIDPAAFGFGNRGPMLDVSVIGTQDYDGASGGLEMSEWSVISPIWTRKWRSIRWTTALGYRFTQIDFAGLGGLTSESLHSVELQTSYFWQRLDSPWWAMAFITRSVSSDMEGDFFAGSNTSALSLVGYRLNNTLTLAGGVFAQSDAIESNIYPALGFIWRPEPYIVQVTPPFVVLGVRPNDRLTLSVSAYPNGGTWALENAAVGRVDISGWQTAGTVSYKLNDHATIALRAGLNFGGEIELYDEQDRVTTSNDLEPAPFAALNLRWAF